MTALHLEDWEPLEMSQKNLFSVEFFGFSLAAWLGFDDLYETPPTIGMTFMPVLVHNEDDDKNIKTLILTISWLKSALCIEFGKKVKND